MSNFKKIQDLAEKVKKVEKTGKNEKTLDEMVFSSSSQKNTKKTRTLEVSLETTEKNKKRTSSKNFDENYEVKLLVQQKLDEVEKHLDNGATSLTVARMLFPDKEARMIARQIKISLLERDLLNDEEFLVKTMNIFKKTGKIDLPHSIEGRDARMVLNRLIKRLSLKK